MTIKAKYKKHQFTGIRVDVLMFHGLVIVFWHRYDYYCARCVCPSANVSILPHDMLWLQPHRRTNHDDVF